ncbi:hypothetical protein [Nostoc sp. 2RC]|uniref:hypothetical protein n=1 Tax=Nostoc sp. 2RC TaxID=2485484 RepID=UPI00162489FA|nr:hypothetical protein [Nostoc sp. 2RC]MBC1238351.1 hypothetical protein [Nostoc sp. 2RC]
MSGEKRRYVNVEEQELRRLREQDSRLRSLQRDLPERLNAIREETNRELQQRLAPLEQRSQQQEQEARKLKSNLAILELQTHQRLREQRKEFQKAIRDSESKQQEALKSEVERLKDGMREGFNEQRRVFLEITAEQRKEYLELNQNLDRKFTELIDEERQAREQLQQRLEQEKQDKATLAQDILDDVQTIWEQIDRNYQHQRFAPGKLNDLTREIKLAQNNIQNGVLEAAIATSQQTYFKLVDLRLELELKQYDWEIRYNAALEDLRSLIAEVQANQKYEIEIGQGDESQKFSLEVDYWTNGSLKKYEQELQEIQTRLQEGASSLTTEEIKEIADHIKNNLQHRLAEIVEQAQQEILSSQLRAEIADKVASVLARMGYRLVNDADAVYAQSDQRQAYLLRLKDATGGEVVTIISPDQEFGKNLVSINSQGKILRDEAAQKRNAEAIFDALKSQGIETPGTTECSEQPRSDIEILFQNALQPRISRTEQINQTAQES